MKQYNMLQKFLKRQGKNELYEVLTNEWRQLAHVTDRLLFWIFLLCTLVISIILLVIIPTEYRLSDDFLDENSYGNV